MPKTIKEERLRWVLPIFNKEIKLKDIAKVCPYSQRSLERWMATYRKFGESGLEPKSTRPKTNQGVDVCSAVCYNWSGGNKPSSQAICCK